MSIQSTALVIHHVQDRAQGTNLSTVTAHTIHHQQGQSTLGAGKVFSEQDKQDLIDVLQDKHSAQPSIIDENILAYGSETLMWFRPRQKTLVNINGNELTAPLPSLIFLAHKGHLSVMAVQGERRPTTNTQLLASGLPNVSLDGSWCSGGNGIPCSPAQRHTEQIERIFFESPFTHWSGAAPKSAKASMDDWFTELSHKRQFPMRSLIEYKQSLGQWFSNLTGR